jgi:plasmid stability protein
MISQETVVAQILIRKLDEEVLRKLQARAKAAGRSTESEARQVLKAAVEGRSTKLTSFIGSGKHSGRSVNEINRYIKKLRSEWP